MDPNPSTIWELTAEQGPSRLDRFLHSRLPAFSMNAVRGLISQGKVMVNGRRAKKGDRVAPGDQVRVAAMPDAPVPAPDYDLKISAVYDDDDLVVLDKPSGVPTHPLTPDETGTLVNAAVARWPGLRSVGDRPLEPGLLHRLDTGTSGLVMFAKNQESFHFMRHEIRMHRVAKTYRALVRGEVKRKSGEVRVALARHPGKSGLMVPVEQGVKFRGKPMEALTRYRVLARAPGLTLLELDLVTGVMHQLRAHLASIGHPVLGDDRYGPSPDPSSRAFALQAERLAFTHPRDRSRVEVRVGRPLQLSDAAGWIP
jgi:23S rRNA pseudouridine1911/1915/1917 synthase